MIQKAENKLMSEDITETNKDYYENQLKRKDQEIGELSIEIQRINVKK